MRTEAEIFSDLESVCASPGYIHVVAYLHWRDNFIHFVAADGLQPDDLTKMNDPTRLIRTEIATLVGLMIKHEISTDLPTPDMFQELIDKTETLLKELHSYLGRPFKIDIGPDGPIFPKENPFSTGTVLREPIFYAAESAYSFQYRDFAPLKYSRDDAWIKNNKGFSIEEAKIILNAIGDIQTTKITSYFAEMREAGIDKLDFDKLTLFPSLIVTPGKISDVTNYPSDLIARVLDSFSMPKPPCNKEFKTIGDFNVANAYPLLKLANDSYVLLQYYNAMEALYETPFFWLLADKKYKDKAFAHRGEFTEQFCANRLACVFGAENIFGNVLIKDHSGNRVGEIDVLVLYSNRAIIVQAKSKRLTIEARKGNDNAIKDDFKKSIQDSFDQGFKCAEYLEDGNYHLFDSAGNQIKLNTKFKEIYIFCVVSDHYPSLAFQAEQFLEFKQTMTILPPFIMDVFFLDALCEILDTPLYFISYVQRRLLYKEKLSSTHEFSILGFHVKKNLYFADEYTVVYIEDSMSTHIDSAMHVRRDGLPGVRTPEGILTKYKKHTFGKLIASLQSSGREGMLDIGLFLLNLSENAAKSLGQAIDKITRQTRADKGLHDFSIAVGNSGLTIHCSNDSMIQKKDKLRNHCLLRKYKQKAGQWLGLAKNDKSNDSYELGLVLDFPWAYSAEMEEIALKNVSGKNYNDISSALSGGPKVGRNELCPCGSKKKYKKCHGSNIDKKSGEMR